MWNYPDYNRTLIDKWKMLTMAQISTLEKERCELIIRKKLYFEKNQINPALLNKLDHLPAELQYYNNQLEKYDRINTTAELPVIDNTDEVITNG